MLLVDTKKKVFLRDEDIKQTMATLRPVQIWLKEVTLMLKKCMHQSGMHQSVSPTYLRSEVKKIYCSFRIHLSNFFWQ